MIGGQNYGIVYHEWERPDYFWRSQCFDVLVAKQAYESSLSLRDIKRLIWIRDSL